MRTKGKIKLWNDDKGFGFIRPNEGGKEVFLHISAFKNRQRRPEIGQIVTYALSTDAQGRPRAQMATLPGDRLPKIKSEAKSEGKSGMTGALMTAGTFFALVTSAVIFDKIPPLVPWWYLGASLLTYLAYGYDKIAAKDRTWRTSESTLHWMSLLGGWPGALVGQPQFRHKTTKQSFRFWFWITVLVNVGVLVWMFMP
jgi:uncharacterized membrane protein YsdA (DUF1294 family)/cold shock CspA family protein